MRYLLFLSISCLLIPAAAQAQATKSIPISRNWGIDTHIPQTVNRDTLVANINRRIARAQEQALRAQRAQQRRLHDQDVRLAREEVANENDYVVTPQGNIRKRSWQACKYYEQWLQQQGALHLPAEQLRTQQEMVLFTFDLTENYCKVLAQQHTLPDVSGVSVLPPANIAQLAQPHITPTEEPLLRVSAHTALPAPEQSSWKDVVDRGYDPAPVSKGKAKRYLKEFLKENKADLERALALKARQERMNPGLRRLLTSYDSLCAQYERSVGQPSPDCRLPS